MPLNFDLAGKAYDPIERTVTGDQIAAYAAASGDANPRHAAGPDQVAPAVFPVVPGFTELGRVVTDPELGVDNPLMIVHGEQEFRYHRPIRPGDKLVLSPTLESVDDKGKGATFVTKVAIATTTGDPVCDMLSTIFVRGGGSGVERARRDAVVPDRAAEVARFTQTVATGMPAQYAEASGDHNPVHLDDNVARAVGLPGVINHGLGTLSLVAGDLVAHLAGGDVGRLRSLKVRFTDMVFPGADITTTIWEEAGAAAGHYLFETARADGAVAVSGALEVAAA
jgi:acyl dehydratase